MTVMMTAGQHPDWYSDVRRVLDAAEDARTLPRPFIGPDRAVFYLERIPHAEGTRAALERVRDVLRDALGVTFSSRRETTGSTRHYILEALMPGGLVVAVVTNGRHIPEDEDMTALIPAASRPSGVAGLIGAAA